MRIRAGLILLCAVLAAESSRAQVVGDHAPGEAAEQHLPTHAPSTTWALDPDRVHTQSGDRIEQREVPAEQTRIVKLRDVVPPIRFESGMAEIPPAHIEKLRVVLHSMRHLENPRLHLIGHADSQPLSETLAETFGDNAGLSRERAGEVAEFLQEALSLPPEAIAFEWAGDRHPIATNATEEGRALNRRVEVEVWYDEKVEATGVEDVVVSHDTKRIKVCRTQTLCKLRYRDGHGHRALLRNLIAPLPFGDDTVGVPGDFIDRIGRAMEELDDRTNVVVRFVGYSDDSPLAGRVERIYGTHLALSKARAHRVALAVKEALDLPDTAIASDGRGSERPLASNDTEKGRALNRRVEVEFWYDDPLKELPDDLQLCPDAAGSEWVTRVHDPAGGRIEPLLLDDDGPLVPDGYLETLRVGLEEIADRHNPRLRFTGYTRNERLDRRTASAYGDDVGLSTARARRAMEAVQELMGLADSKVEHEGRGYVHSNDVVNGGFIQGETSHVRVQLVYDELAVQDAYEGVEITPANQELGPEDPLSLNMMRITVDGVPIDDPGRSSVDIQRCTDVALDRADIRFRFDTLEAERRLSVTARPASLPVRTTPAGEPDVDPVVFQAYSNYASFIDHLEVRIFDRDQSVRDDPLEVVAVDGAGFARWMPDAGTFAGPVRELKYVLRVYDDAGLFDETLPQSFWMFHAEPGTSAAIDPGAGLPGVAATDGSEVDPGQDPLAPAPPGSELHEGYGRNDLAVRNIPLSGGRVEVQGSGIPPRHTVWLAGDPVPVDESGRFVAETLLPSGVHTVEVAVLDETGDGELFLRDLELRRSDWFYLGMADLTFADSDVDGPMDSLVGANAPLDSGSSADGRLAFYVNGRFEEVWKFTASADTREGPLEDLFSNFLDKSPESLLRRIDPDHHYATFGDDGTVEETAPTMGKFFMKLSRYDSHAMWGNFKVSYLDNELAQFDRGLYGGNLRYVSSSTTGFGEKQLAFDAFAAEPGTVPSREEFRGTGGSVYFLNRKDILSGSESVRIEARDRDSGLVTSVVRLRPSLDYDIDYIQGRIMLTEPLTSTASTGTLVRTGVSSGDEAWLVVQYEHTPGFDEVDAVASGGQGHLWLNNFVKIGLTANGNSEGEADARTYAGDLILRKSADSWIKLQAGRRNGEPSNVLQSLDGGFGFLGSDALGSGRADSDAYRADLNVGFEDFFASLRGRLTFYVQELESGYSAPGLTAFQDTELFGGTLELPLTQRLQLSGRSDTRVQSEGVQTAAHELDLSYRLASKWSLSAGVRHDLREDNSAIVPVTQNEGERTDAVLQVAHDSGERWRAYGFAQDTLSASGSREDNARIGLGGAYRLTDRILLDGEASHGDLGPAGKLGTTYQYAPGTSVYLNYALENERTDNGLESGRGSLTAGARMRLSDSTSVYMEDRYQDRDSMTGLTHAAGITVMPANRWNLGLKGDFGTLTNRDTGADTERRAGSARIGYGFDRVQVSGTLEYRVDDAEQLDGSWAERKTWLLRSSLKLELMPDWRVIGRLAFSDSESSLGEIFDGGYAEAVLGYAYRPVAFDRLNVLAKYTYLYDVPNVDEISPAATPAAFIQKSHVTSIDVIYDVTSNLSVGAKYAYRLGMVSLDREDPEFLENNAQLYIARSDWRFLKHWEASAELRVLDLPELDDRRTGALISINRYLLDRFKVGVGYNFTDFSDDLTDLSYDHHGFFINIVMSM